ncbi:MAG TPA: hypothetical protein EYP09_05900 [Anaerolineae bacterium]|nr:hypothetical protein [Anaerolineae bacterium]
MVHGWGDGKGGGPQSGSSSSQAPKGVRRRKCEGAPGAWASSCPWPMSRMPSQNSGPVIRALTGSSSWSQGCPSNCCSSLRWACSTTWARGMKPSSGRRRTCASTRARAWGPREAHGKRKGWATSAVAASHPSHKVCQRASGGSASHCQPSEVSPRRPSPAISPVAAAR